MKYPCGMIKDLLPLYIDEVCTGESREAIESHLAECAGCRTCYETMKGTGGMEEGNCAPGDLEMASSLKNVKKRLNRKVARIVLAVVAAAVTCLAGYHLLFNVPMKNVPLEAVTVSANVYPVEELADYQGTQELDPETAVIYAGENDDSELITVRIPEIGNEIIAISADLADKYEFISVVTFQSDYFLRTILREVKGDTMYITAIRTTYLNNKTTFQNNICTMEFSEIDKIVFVDQKGNKTLLWSR